MIGYSPGRDYDCVEVNRLLRRMHRRVVNDTVQAIEQAGGAVQIDVDTDLLIVNDEFTTSIVIGRCLTTPTGARRWKLRLDARLRPDITVAIRMDSANREPLDYYLLPGIDISQPRLHLAEENGFLLDAYGFDSVEAGCATAWPRGSTRGDSVPILSPSSHAPHHHRRRFPPSSTRSWCRRGPTWPWRIRRPHGSNRRAIAEDHLATLTASGVSVCAAIDLAAGRRKQRKHPPAIRAQATRGGPGVAHRAGRRDRLRPRPIGRVRRGPGRVSAAGARRGARPRGTGEGPRSLAPRAQFRRLAPTVRDLRTDRDPHRG
jgi:hypothetical protein